MQDALIMCVALEVVHNTDNHVDCIILTHMKYKNTLITCIHPVSHIKANKHTYICDQILKQGLICAQFQIHFRDLVNQLYGWYNISLIYDLSF